MDRKIPTRKEVESYLKDRRNWGRWKDNPGAGTINLITEQKKIEAAKRVALETKKAELEAAQSELQSQIDEINSK